MTTGADEDEDQLSLDLTGPGRSRRRDPQTSHDAARLGLPRKASQRRAVLDAHYLHAYGWRGLTDDELSRQLPAIRLNSLTTRRSELVSMGWLVDSGERRQTEAGSEAVVWTMKLQARLRYRGLVVQEQAREGAHG